MIAFLIIVYTGVVLVLFKVFHLKPTPYLIASMVLAGVLMIGGVVVWWTQSAPLTGQLVTTQYVVQLVPYVKGQVKAVYAEANRPMRKGDLLLEIDPAPYQYTVDQLEAQLKVSKANVEEAQAGAQAADANVAKGKDAVAQAQAALDQAKAAVANAEAALNKAKAGDELAKTQEQIALNIQRADVAAISQQGALHAARLQLTSHEWPNLHSQTGQHRYLQPCAVPVDGPERQSRTRRPKGQLEAAAKAKEEYFNDMLRCRSKLTRELSHEMRHAFVCRRLHSIRGVSVAEYRSAECA
jgi:hypothetical protein